MSFVCKECDSKEYVSQYALNRHRKEVHGQFDLRIQTYPYDTFKHKCLEGCLVSFSTTRELRQHLAREHAIYTQQAIFEFEDADDFMTWKTNSLLEEQYGDNGPTLNGNLEVTYYCCLGTNIQQPEIKTEIEEGGEESINFENTHNGISCTSEMIVVKNLKTNIVAVTYFKTHYGHANNTEYIKTPIKVSARKKLNITTSLPERLVVTSNFSEQKTKRKRNKSYVHKLRPNPKKKISIKKSNQVIYVQEPNMESDDSEEFSESYRTDSYEDGNRKSDGKTKLKKEIFYLIQELSENKFEEYDEDTLALVKDTLRECCYFLNSYESSEDPVRLSNINQDNPTESCSSPPKLVWFNK